MAKKDNKRFIKVFQEDSLIVSKEIFVDRETGINYLFICEGGSAGGLTPLLGRDGKPVITPVNDDYDE